MARTAPPAIAADLDAVRADMATADIVKVSRARVVRVVRVVGRPAASAHAFRWIYLYLYDMRSSINILDLF